MVTPFWPSQAWVPRSPGNGYELPSDPTGFPLPATWSRQRLTPPAAGWQSAAGGLVLLEVSGPVGSLPGATSELLAAAWAPDSRIPLMPLCL